MAELNIRDGEKKEVIDLKEFYRQFDEMINLQNRKDIVEKVEAWLLRARQLEDKNAIIAIGSELGGLYRITGDPAKAKSICRDVLALIEEKESYTSENYATALLNYADVFVMTEDFELALGYFERAKTIFENLDIQDDYKMAALYNNMSHSYTRTGKLDEAEDVLNRAIGHIGGKPAFKSEEATTRISLGDLHLSKNAPDEARKQYNRAMSIFDSMPGTKNPHYAAALSGMGQVFYIEKEYEMAKSFFERALKMIEEQLGKNEYYRRVESNLDMVRGEMEKTEE